MNSDIKSARVHVEPVPVIFRWGNSKLPQSMDKPIILHFSVPSLVSETSILEIKILIFRFPVQLLLTVFYRLCGYGERYKDDNKQTTNMTAPVTPPSMRQVLKASGRRR